MDNLKIALIQFDIQWEDTSANLNFLTREFEYMKQDVDLVVLPEMFHCGFSMTPTNCAQKNGGVVLPWMQKMSAEYNFALIGSVVVAEGDHFYNRLYYVNGDEVKWYNKRHLFTMGGEDEFYTRGDERIIIELKGWKLCPLICYDLRFPVWSRNTKEAYDVLMYVANWPAPRRDVWNCLLKARALENQCYVVGVNRIGTDVSNCYKGDTQLIDAKGCVMINLNEKADIAYVDLEKEALEEFRNKFPVLLDGDEYLVKV